MDFNDLLQVVIEAHDALPCPSENCKICIDVGHDNYKVVNHIELRHTEDKRHAVFVFYHDEE